MSAFATVRCRRRHAREEVDLVATDLDPVGPTGWVAGRHIGLPSLRQKRVACSGHSTSPASIQPSASEASSCEHVSSRA